MLAYDHASSQKVLHYYVHVCMHFAGSENYPFCAVSL